MSVKIALISATALAIPPAAAAVAEALPGSVVWNLLDDRLLQDAKPDGITAPLAARMDQLIELAIAGGADGVLLTCSQYGIRAEARAGSPGGPVVLSADGALFADTVARRPGRVLLVASLESAAADSSTRLAAAFSAAGVQADIVPLVVAAAARPTTEPELLDLLADAIGAVAEAYDVIVLAQYSLAPATAGLAARFDAPVLDGPGSAARRLSAEIAETAEFHELSDSRAISERPR